MSADERDPEGEKSLQALEGQITLQLLERCAFDLTALSELDQLAIKSAIRAAIVEGFNRGCEKVAMDVVDQGFTIDLAWGIVQVVDEWARATDETDGGA